MGELEKPPLRVHALPRLPSATRIGTVRCSICHDSSGALEVCAGCGTLVHAECRATSPRCPSLGCSGVRRPTAERSPGRAARRDGGAPGPWPWPFFVGGPLLVLTGLAVWLPDHTSPVQDFSLAVSLGVSVATLGRFFVAHLRGERTRDWIVYVALLLTTPAWSTALAWTILRVFPDPYRLRS